MSDIGIKDVTVTIDKAEIPGIAGLNIPLVIQGGATSDIAFTECKRISDVVEAGFADTTEVYKQCAAIFEQDNRPEKVAVCATTEKIVEMLPTLKNKDFRQIIAIPAEDGDTLKELADYVNTTLDKMLFITVDSIAKLPATKSDRVFAIVYGGKSKCVEGAIVGATAGLVTGTFTYKNIVLKGIEPEDINISEVEKIHEAGAICILRKAGDVVTSEGNVMSGEYADIIDGIDYILNTIEYDCQKLFNVNPRIPYTNAGISQLETTVYNVLAGAFNMGIIDEDDKGVARFSTSFLKKEECEITDRKKRVYNGGVFEFALRGAIHYANIRGTLVI